jgi:hypothetical protein
MRDCIASVQTTGHLRIGDNTHKLKQNINILARKNQEEVHNNDCIVVQITTAPQCLDGNDIVFCKLEFQSQIHWLQ